MKILLLALSLFASPALAMKSMDIPAHYSRFVTKQLSVTSAQSVLPALTSSDILPTGSSVEMIFVQAVSTNTASITIGHTGVSDKGPGVELAAGANYIIPSNRISDWFAITSTGSQKLNVIYFAGAE